MNAATDHRAANNSLTSPLQQLLHSYRSASLTEREKGPYFEDLTLAYLRHEATYADLYLENSFLNAITLFFDSRLPSDRIFGMDKFV